MSEDELDDWPDYKRAIYKDQIAALRRLGAKVYLGDDGEIQYVRFTGPKYDDSALPDLERLVDLNILILDVRDTDISPNGVARLQRALPITIIDH